MPAILVHLGRQHHRREGEIYDHAVHWISDGAGMFGVTEDVRTVAQGRDDIAWIGGEDVLRLTPMPSLISAIREAFKGNGVAPLRHAHDVSKDASLLLMPAWRPSGPIGVKVTTIHARASPSVQASYLLMDGETGRPQALIDGSMLTSRRTAAASALAADYLARPDAKTLLVIGTGTLVPHLIEAHASVRPIRDILIWGRNPDKAGKLVTQVRSSGYHADIVDDLDEAVARANIVSAATLSQAPLVRGAAVRPGTHLDLVGAFKPDMCEADPATFARARIFVDTREGVLDEAGDLIQAIAAGAISVASIEADLAELCSTSHSGRALDAAAVTLFKSVGTSLEDLAGAELVANAWRREQGGA